MDIQGHSTFLRKEFPGGTLLLHYKPRRKSLLRCVHVAELLVEEDPDAGHVDGSQQERQPAEALVVEPDAQATLGEGEGFEVWGGHFPEQDELA
jgi:hypothetical protein